MQKPRTRRQQLAIRSFTYGVMTLLAVLGVLFCLAWAMGFRFDWNGGKLTQVGLLQFNSFPTGASIDVNGERVSSGTPSRLNVKTGATTVVMSKKGYRTWHKTVNINPSEVVWLDYARLIPASITTDTVKNFSDVEEMRESPDKHWILLRTSDNSRYDNPTERPAKQSRKDYYKRAFTLTLADISDAKNVRFSTLSLPSSKITLPTSQKQTEKFQIVEWDQGSRYILVKHSVGKTTEYLELDREKPSTVKNLSRDFNMNLTDPHFSGTSGEVFFALTGTDIRKFDYDNSSVSAPLVSNVQNYAMYGSDQFAYVATDKHDDRTAQIVGIYNAGKPTTVKTYDKVMPVTVKLTRFDNVDYLAVARDETVSIYPDPLDKDTKAQSIYLNSPGGVDWLDISPSGRFVIAAKGEDVVTYDLDSSERYSFEVDSLDGAPEWLDDCHIVVNNNGNISFVEFDGANREDIVGAYSRAILSRNGDYLFSISDSSSGTVLQRSQLVI